MAKSKLSGVSGHLPLITLIIPVYNAELYLRHTLESVRKQTYRNLEILLVDDGSTDGSASIMMEYVNLDRRFRLISKPNSGVSASRNAGLEAATGEWIAWADSDDEIPPRAIETLYAAAAKRHTAMSMGAYNESHEGKHGWVNRRVGAHPAVLRSTEEAQCYFLTYGQFLNHMWTKLFRRDVFDHVRFPVGMIYEDIYVMPYLIEAAGSCTVVNEVVYNYRVRQGSLSTSLNISRQMDGVKAREATADFMRERHPELLGLANDAILPMACNVLGKIEHVGRASAEHEWNETIALTRRILPECSLQNPIYRVGAWSFEKDPKLISKLTHFLLVADKML